MFKVIEPIPLNLLANIETNITQEYPTWLIGTTYAANDFVVKGIYLYQSVVGSNTGNDPEIDDGSFWVRLGYENRWRAYDRKFSTKSTNAEEIQYTVTLPLSVDSIAIFGLDGAEATITVTDPVDEVVLYEETIQLISDLEIIDAWTYAFNEINYSTRIILNDLPGFSGNILEILVTSPGGIAAAGEIFIGNSRLLGEVDVDSSLGIEDYSIKERDEFGNIIVVERGFTTLITYQFTFPTQDANRLKELMTRIRAIPSVYYDDELYDLGLTTAGFYKDFRVPLTTTMCHSVLEVESLM